MSVTLPEAPTTPAPTPQKPAYYVIQDLLDELEALDDVNMIAGLFESEEILATPCNAGGCAVAVYLQRHSGIDDINVGNHFASVWMSANAGPDWIWEFGPTVHEFITRFDSGSYPELLWPEERATWAGGHPFSVSVA